MTSGGRRRGPRHEGGQALVEFALGSTVLLLLLAAAIDFGTLYSNRLELDNAARVGVRWAAKHPSAWTSSANPADNTIEGQIVYSGDTRNIPNNDSHINISYYIYDRTSQTFTLCGGYSQTAAAFQAQTGYTQATCVVPGTFIKVTISYQYPVLTPVFQNLFGAGIPISSDATMLEEV